MTRRHRFVTRKKQVEAAGRSVEIATAFLDDGAGTPAKEGLVLLTCLERGGVRRPVALSPADARWIAEALLHAVAVAEEES